MPVRDRFFSRVLHHAQTDVVVELIHRHGVVLQLARTATLEDDDGLGRFRGEFLCHQEAGPTASNDGDVYGLEIGHERASLPFSNIPARRSSIHTATSSRQCRGPLVEFPDVVVRLRRVSPPPVDDAESPTLCASILEYRQYKEVQ